MKKIITAVAIFLSTNLFAQSNLESLPNEFKATYEAYYEGDKVGTLEKHFYKKNDNEYVLKSNSMIDGYYGFIPFTDNRDETSNFTIDENNVFHPNNYIMKRTGTWLDFKMKISFDYTKNIVNFSYKDRKAVKDINGNILDNALYQLRLQHDIKNGKKETKHDVAYKTGFRDFHFAYEKNEILDTKYGKVDSIKFKQIRKNKKGEHKGVSSWFDPNKDFVMNKLIYFNKKGKEEARFELIKYETFN